MPFLQLSQYLRRIATKMSAPSRIDLSPPRFAEMKVLDKSRFQKSIPVLAVRVDAHMTGSILRSTIMKKLVFGSEHQHAAYLYRVSSLVVDWPKIRNVVKDPVDPDGRRLILLRVADEGMNHRGDCGKQPKFWQVSRFASRSAAFSGSRMSRSGDLYSESGLRLLDSRWVC
jgi:hypothetical protein